MATLTPTLQDHDYQNWVKGGLALKFSKDGIENFVETNIDNFHQNVLTTLPAGHYCYICSTENIVQCKNNNNFCKFSKNSCTVHNSKDPNKKSRPCPSSVCNVIRDEVLKQHRFHGPSWKNTDSSRWCREPWQLATCYMSAGYTASTSAAQTDLPGLLSVVINNKIFETEVTDNLSNKNNLFCQARDARNFVLHKGDMTLSDADLAAHIKTLDNMLSDAKCLARHPSAIKARILLQQLLNGTIHVTTRHEAEVLAEALRSIDDKKVEAIAAVNKEKDEAQVVIKSEKDEALEAVDKKKDEARVVIKTEKVEAVAAVNKEKDNAKEEIISRRKEAITSIDNKEKLIVANLQKALHEAHRSIKEIKEEAVPNLQTTSTDSYDKIKKELKKELLSVYQDGEHMSTSLGPVADDEDTHIEDLYVDPSIKHDGIPVQSYQDIFKAGKKKIFIVGEAGTGKSSLCQKIVSTWYQINTQQKGNMGDNQQAIAKFDYLFYISLRHVITDDTIDEMIKHHLLPNKSNLHAPLSRVLDEEKCLIILDGLDEWTTENKTAKSAQVNSGLPGRDAVRNCTVLTTTRPWKLESLQLKSTQIDIKVELLGIDESSSKQLIQNMITHLNDKFHKRKTYEDFATDTHDKELDKLTSIPVVLKQIVCLWHGGKQLGKNKTAIYCQMLELLLELAKKRLDKDSEYLKKKEEWKKSLNKFHSCFEDNETCQDVMPLLVAIAELAFLTLLNKDQESSLVFKSSREGCHNLSSEEVNICLKIGILSKDKFVIDCTSRYTIISFLHKSFQELLAAIFVSLKPKQCVEAFKSFCNNEYKCREMSNVLTFISGTCTSATTCTLVQHYDDNKINLLSISNNIIDCMREGWTCSHHNKHLYCDHIGIREPSEYLEQLCQVNIPNIKELAIFSPPTAQCLQYLLQIHKLKKLIISPQSHSSIREDLVYDLIHHHRHRLTYIRIERMTLRSNTRLSTLIPQLRHLTWLHINDTTLPQQLLTSLKALDTGISYRIVPITNPTILPATESTN